MNEEVKAKLPGRQRWLSFVSLGSPRGPKISPTLHSGSIRDSTVSSLRSVCPERQLMTGLEDVPRRNSQRFAPISLAWPEKARKQEEVLHAFTEDELSFGVV